MVKERYGSFKVDCDYTYMDARGNFCFYQINQKNELVIHKVCVKENMNTEIFKNHIRSDSEYKPVFFREGEWKLG